MRLLHVRLCATLDHETSPHAVPTPRGNAPADTSGTTGLPKAASLSHRTIVNNGMLVGHFQNLSEKDKV